MPNSALLFTLGGVFAFGASAPGQQSPANTPASVMIVGDFHMSNPGRDLHNVEVPDVMEPKPQAQIAEVTDALAKFQPTAVMVEWPADSTNERYAQYLAGTLPPSRNEVVQLGFRLAKKAGLSKVYGIDVDGDFPYEPVKTFADAHGQTGILDREGAATEAQVRDETELLKTKGVAATLRYVNDPERVSHNNAFYRQVLRVGEGSQQPGADLLTAWYRRNFLICANLLQNTHPGDRVVVFYGSGHAFLLRQCVQETPGFRLVEPNEFLPR